MWKWRARQRLDLWRMRPQTAAQRWQPRCVAELAMHTRHRRSTLCECHYASRALCMEQNLIAGRGRLSFRPNTELRSPYAVGVGSTTVDDWDLLEAVWAAGFADLLRPLSAWRSKPGADTSAAASSFVGANRVPEFDGRVDLPVLVSESLYTVQPQREKCVAVCLSGFGYVAPRSTALRCTALTHASVSMVVGMSRVPLACRHVEMMFETFGVPALYMAKEAVLTSVSFGRATALVVDFGADSTSVVPVHDGYALNKGVQRSDVGGDMLTDQLTKLLRRKGATLRPQYAFSRKVRFDAPAQHAACTTPLTPSGFVWLRMVVVVVVVVVVAVIDQKLRDGSWKLHKIASATAHPSFEAWSVRVCPRLPKPAGLPPHLDVYAARTLWTISRRHAAL